MTAARRPIVALVTDSVYPYNHGGKEQRTYELAAHLSRTADLHVYTMKWWRGRRVRREPDVTYHGVCRAWPLYSQGRRSITQALFFAFGCMRLLWGHFDVLEVDHMPYLQIPVLWIVARLRRKRLVVTWHEVWGRQYWLQYLGWAGSGAWLVEWCAMRLPDHIIAASPQTADRLRSALTGEAGISVAPNGIDLNAIRAAVPIDSPVDLTVVSRLLPHKRIDMLLDAVALLHAEGFTVTCRVIGDGPERDKLRQRAAALGVATAIAFRHDVASQAELYGLLKSARVFVFPSAREGFGIAALEAIACGLPVVTTSAPDNLAQHLVARSSRSVICDPSAQGVADSIKGFLADGHGYPCRDETTEDWLFEYSWEQTAAKVSAALGI